MKKILVAVALFAFIGSGTAATVVAMNNDTKVEMKGETEKKEKKKKKDKKGCCAPKTAEATSTDKKGGCCSKGTTSTGTNGGSCHGKTEQK